MRAIHNRGKGTGGLLYPVWLNNTDRRHTTRDLYKEGGTEIEHTSNILMVQQSDTRRSKRL